MRRWILITLLFAGLAARSAAVASGSLALTIVRAEQKSRDRVVLYLVDTPIYQEDPYFEVVVRSGGLVIVGDRDPDHRGETLPDGWKPGVAVQGRVDKHHVYLRRPNGSYARFIITRRAKAQAGQQE
jgi:hypothetical protein